MIGEGNKISRSFCGTEQYMAPEMLLQQGHTFRMDWWSLGLLMHEMMSAKHPFHGPTHYDTLRNMVTKQPNIDTRISTEAADVIRQLLINNPKTRLCSKSGISEMKELPYFIGTDWDGLYRLEVPMPFSPNVTSSTDVSSFETLFTNEAPVDSVSEQYKAKSKAEGRSFFSMLGFGFGKKKGDEKVSNKAEEDSFAGFAYTREDIEEGGTSTVAGAAQSDADTGSRV
jgi:serum/glucocorticoid-regulated kinase 2